MNNVEDICFVYDEISLLYFDIRISWVYAEVSLFKCVAF